MSEKSTPGTLYFACEGRNGSEWAFIPRDTSGSNERKTITLENGDCLTVYAYTSLLPVWTGTIDLIPHEPGTKEIQGFFVLTTQRDVPEKTWISWFFNHYYAELARPPEKT